MLIRIIKSYRDIVTICDSNLLGKRFEGEKFQLEVKDSFFGGEETNKEKTISIMQRMSKGDASFNIVGEKSISAALEAGIVTQQGIKKIQGIPFALILL